MFLAQPDSLILTRDFAERNGIQTGSKHLAGDHGGPQAVHGSRHPEGRRDGPGVRRQSRRSWTSTRRSKCSGAAGASTASISACARASRWSRARRRCGRRSGRASQWSRPPAAARDFESLLGVYTLALKVSSVFALFIGMFIIYNSFAIAVTQRRSEIGILRALGATRGQIRTLFLAESAVAGTDRLAGRGGARGGVRAQPDRRHRRDNGRTCSACRQNAPGRDHRSAAAAVRAWRWAWPPACSRRSCRRATPRAWSRCRRCRRANTRCSARARTASRGERRWRVHRDRGCLPACFRQVPSAVLPGLCAGDARRAAAGAVALAGAGAGCCACR